MARISEPERRRQAKQTEQPVEGERHLVAGLHRSGLPERILRRAEVEQATGLPRATIYDKISKGMFPRPIKLGERSVGWLATEITEWQKARVVERDGVAAGERRDRLVR